MKCEGFSQISDLLDFLSNNLIIAYYCGFNVMANLPSYATAVRLNALKAAVVLAITNAGITARKTVVAPST